MPARTTPHPGGAAETEIAGSLTSHQRPARRPSKVLSVGSIGGAPMMSAQARLRLEPTRRNDRATKGTDSGVYRVTEIIGTSNVSWEDGAKTAVETAAKSLRDLRVAEVTKLDMKIEGGKVVAFRAKVSLSFKYEA